MGESLAGNIAGVVELIPGKWVDSSRTLSDSIFICAMLKGVAADPKYAGKVFHVDLTARCNPPPTGPTNCIPATTVSKRWRRKLTTSCKPTCLELFYSEETQPLRATGAVFILWKSKIMSEGTSAHHARHSILLKPFSVFCASLFQQIDGSRLRRWKNRRRLMNRRKHVRRTEDVGVAQPKRNGRTTESLSAGEIQGRHTRRVGRIHRSTGLQQ